MKKVCMFLVLCLVAMVAYGQDDVNDNPTMDIKAKGLDLDIGFVNPEHSARTSIKAEIEFDADTGDFLLLRDVVFSMKIFDGAGEKVYTMEGELENTTVTLYPYWPCNVRNVVWTDVWFVMGMGKVKTTDVDIEIEYRGEIITLPNTGGEYETRFLVIAVSPLGEVLVGEPWGGWAYAGVVTSFDPALKAFGGITWLTKYMEKWVP